MVGIADRKRHQGKKKSLKIFPATEVIRWQQRILKMKVGWPKCDTTTRWVAGVGTMAKP